ncbi:uncharacterized protein G2W53_032623 [Senna tora]|uniref:Uncharacterized protein n=1 Tax=Senna tora TaxID=362788 RepID=A0A834SYM5_9FABA|nr:uncharacterized protein G2W53_032623 [Senna tora]
MVVRCPCFSISYSLSSSAKTKLDSSSVMVTKLDSSSTLHEEGRASDREEIPKHKTELGIPKMILASILF